MTCAVRARTPIVGEFLTAPDSYVNVSRHHAIHYQKLSQPRLVHPFPPLEQTKGLDGFVLPTCTRRLALANNYVGTYRTLKAVRKANLTVGFCAIEEWMESGDEERNNLMKCKSCVYKTAWPFSLTSVCALKVASPSRPLVPEIKAKPQQ